MTCSALTRIDMTVLALALLAPPVFAQDEKGDDKKAPAPAPRLALKSAMEPLDLRGLATLEDLVRAIEDEGYFRPKPKRAPEKIAAVCLGKRVPLVLDPQLVFEPDNHDRARELSFIAAYDKAYGALADRAFAEARRLIQERELLPKARELDQAEGRWVKDFLKKYRPGKAIKVKRKASPEAREDAALKAELALVLDGARRIRARARGMARRGPLAGQLDQREARLDMQLRRYQNRPIAFATRRGSAVCELHLNPALIDPIERLVERQRAFPVSLADGSPVKIGERQLFVCWSFGLPEVFRLLKDVTHEVFVARYLRKEADDSKEVFKVIGARLLRGRTWLLITQTRIVVQTEDGIGGRKR